jgi:DNA-binding response OmpR family regulator
MKTILIADDDPDIIALLSSRLRANDYEVITADTGVLAVTEAVKKDPDLIILDIKMPYGEGVSVYEQLKKYLKTFMIPVIFITAYPSEELKAKAIELGAKGFIPKPFEIQQLLNTVKSALGDKE